MTTSDATTKIHLSELDSLIFCTTHAYVSAYLMSELAKAKVRVIFSDEKCLPVAESLPLHAAHNSAERIAEQIQWNLPSKKRVWQTIIKHKIALQAQVLELNDCVETAGILKGYIETVHSGDPTNREAVAAARYFIGLFGEAFNRDSGGPINACLDYGYSIILSKAAREIVSRGYLPQLGIHHKGKLNPWNLACDFMEPFRPYVDLAIRSLAEARLDTSTRHKLVSILNNTVWYQGGNYKLTSVMSRYVKDCLEALAKRKNASEICCYEL